MQTTEMSQQCLLAFLRMDSCPALCTSDQIVCDTKRTGGWLGREWELAR